MVQTAAFMKSQRRRAPHVPIAAPGYVLCDAPGGNRVDTRKWGILQHVVDTHDICFFPFI